MVRDKRYTSIMRMQFWHKSMVTFGRVRRMGGLSMHLINLDHAESNGFGTKAKPNIHESANALTLIHPI